MSNYDSEVLDGDLYACTCKNAPVRKFGWYSQTFILNGHKPSEWTTLKGEKKVKVCFVTECRRSACHKLYDNYPDLQLLDEELDSNYSKQCFISFGEIIGEEDNDIIDTKENKKEEKKIKVFATMHIDHHYAYQGLDGPFSTPIEMINHLKKLLEKCGMHHSLLFFELVVHVFSAILYITEKSNQFKEVKVGELDETKGLLYYTGLQHLGFPKQIWMFGFEVELIESEYDNILKQKQISNNLFPVFSASARKQLVALGVPLYKIQF